MGLLQEKFQTTFPEPKGNHEWVESSRARRSKPSASQSVGSDEGLRGRKLNQLPPGDNIGDQQWADVRNMPRSLAGRTDRTNYSSAEALAKGYTRLNVSPTDDAYTQEHYDPFYRSARSGDDEGFVERNNMLDRS